MSNCSRAFRFGIKKGVGVPTIPVSSDHQNGDWIDTDIYEGEQYQDTDTGITYSRSGASIIKSGSVPNEDVVLKFRIHQSSTAAPTVIPYFNPYGYTLTTIRDAAGIYRVLGLSGETMADTNSKYEFVLSRGYQLAYDRIVLNAANDTQIQVTTSDNTGTNADNLMTEFTGGSLANWTVVTIVKYS